MESKRFRTVWCIKMWDTRTISQVDPPLNRVPHHNVPEDQSRIHATCQFEFVHPHQRGHLQQRSYYTNVSYGFQLEFIRNTFCATIFSLESGLDGAGVVDMSGGRKKGIIDAQSWRRVAEDCFRLSFSFLSPSELTIKLRDRESTYPVAEVHE